MYKDKNPVLSIFEDEFNARRENTELFLHSLLQKFDDEIHTIPHMLYNTRSNFGGRSAQMYKEDGEWKIISYDNLVYRTENLALALIKLGMQAGDRTGIKAHTSAQWTWADLATLMAGCVTTSLYASLSQRETTFIVNHAEVKLLFVDTIDSLFEVISFRRDLPTLQYLVCMEKNFVGNGKDIWGLGELITLGQASRSEYLPILNARTAALKGTDPAALVYTSGTTGDLKGVMHSHKNLCYGCTRSMKHYFNCGHVISCDTVLICALPLSHIVEKCNTYYVGISVGGILGFSEVKSLAEDYQVIRPTGQMFVPRLLSRLLLGIERRFTETEQGRKLWDWAMDVAVRATYAMENEDGCINTNIPIPKQLEGELQREWIDAYNKVFWRIHNFFGGRLKEMNCGGAALDPILHRKLIGIGFFVGYGYGLTETAAGITNATPSATLPGFTSQLNPGVEYRLDDDGELLLRGNGIITEYYKNEKATQEGFTEDGFFRTGDIAEISDCGYIRIVDRKKSLIVLDTGKNVPMSLLESLCDSQGLIEQIVVVGQDRKYVAALIVPNYDAVLAVLTQAAVPYDQSKIKAGLLNGMPATVAVGEDVINHDLVQRVIQNAIDKVNERVEKHETIKRFRLLPRRFTEEEGEVTASMKLKLKVIHAKYKEEIDSLYV
jgi:long-chain acyl-CoA synthetase